MAGKKESGGGCALLVIVALGLWAASEFGWWLVLPLLVVGGGLLYWLFQPGGPPELGGASKEMRSSEGGRTIEVSTRLVTSADFERERERQQPAREKELRKLAWPIPETIEPPRLDLPVVAMPSGDRRGEKCEVDFANVRCTCSRWKDLEQRYPLKRDARRLCPHLVKAWMSSGKPLDPLVMAFVGSGPRAAIPMHTRTRIRGSEAILGFNPRDEHVYILCRKKRKADASDSLTGDYDWYDYDLIEDRWDRGGPYGVSAETRDELRRMFGRDSVRLVHV